MHADLDLIEQTLPAAPAVAAEVADLAGLVVLYVGGRPGLLTTLRGLADRLHIDLLEHDGGAASPAPTRTLN